jgi:hypothetical protein
VCTDQIQERELLMREERWKRSGIERKEKITRKEKELRELREQSIKMS